MHQISTCLALALIDVDASDPAVALLVTTSSTIATELPLIGLFVRLAFMSGSSSILLRILNPLRMLRSLSLLDFRYWGDEEARRRQVLSRMTVFLSLRDKLEAMLVLWLKPRISSFRQCSGTGIIIVGIAEF